MPAWTRWIAGWGQYVDDGRLPGWALAVSRHGHLAHVQACGQRDMEAGLPVETGSPAALSS